MLKSMLCVAAALVAAASFGYQNPVVTPGLVKLKPGQQATLTLTTYWSGLTPLPQENQFGSDLPEVAEISGSLSWSGVVGDPVLLEPIQVNALAPGIAHVVDMSRTDHRVYATVIVECETTDVPVAFPVNPSPSTSVGAPVKLQLGTGTSMMLNSEWLEGPSFDRASPIASNTDRLTLTYRTVGIFHVWVHVWDSCNHNIVEFTVSVLPLRHRTVRP